MKYILYIDYRASYKPSTVEYRPLNSSNIKDAIAEADTTFNSQTMYLVRLMEKTGKIAKVESNVKAQTFNAILEKRSNKWAAPDRSHTVKRFVTKFCNWYVIA